MKKILILPFVFTMFFSTIGKAQILNVPQVIQEYNQWCWSACSKCILDYYGVPLNQCDIAEYARTSVTWTSYGTSNCCVDPNQGCNYWNYNFGYAGSIQDILIHFDGIQNTGTYTYLTVPQINAEMAGGRPFVVRWGWSTGGGHFVVGHGISANDVSYMNPWFGEGYHVADHSWLVYDGTHTWTHTNVLTTSPTSVNGENVLNEELTVFPNPAKENFSVSIDAEQNIDQAEFILTDVSGREVMKSVILEHQTQIGTGNVSSGIYFYQLINAGETIGKGKLIVE